MAKGKVLVLVSSGRGLPLKDDKVYAGAGYYLNELTVPVRALMKEGYEITFANPKGNTPHLDEFSATAQFFGGDEDVTPAVVRRRRGCDVARHPHHRHHGAGAARTSRAGRRAQCFQLSDAKAAAASIGCSAFMQIKRQVSDDHATAIVDQRIQEPVAAIEREYAAGQRPDRLREPRIGTQPCNGPL